MKTEKAISIDFHNSIKQAEKLEQCAKDLQSISKQLNDIMSTLNEGWKGEAATLYLQKCEQLVEKVDKSAKDLNTTSLTIKKTAKGYYDAEKAALKIASERTYV